VALYENIYVTATLIDGLLSTWLVMERKCCHSIATFIRSGEEFPMPFPEGPIHACKTGFKSLPATAYGVVIFKLPIFAIAHICRYADNITYEVLPVLLVASP
jgi:hypothetical protein